MRPSATTTMWNNKVVIFLLSAVSVVIAQSGKCDQTPPLSKVLTPSENNGLFLLHFNSKEKDAQNLYMPDQTYIMSLTATNKSRPFRSFMITAEDPAFDDNDRLSDQMSDVGSLKTLDTDRLSRYSERCHSSVENTDYSEKYHVEIHWVSPKYGTNGNRVRIRAMVAENSEAWYVGDLLTTELTMNTRRPIDSPPYPPNKTCNLCSEARYEVIFKGKWSRLSHPRHYPKKPDENGYSYMIGASHSYDYTLWKQGVQASVGLKLLAENEDISLIQTEIIQNMDENKGTRTLILGKQRHHPYMFEPSHSLFRVDRIHHLFSIVVAMRPSPDWFLGTSKFELCTDTGWLENSEIPLYPWDAGTMDGISYEDTRTVTQPPKNVERVAIGSIDQKSPFYQMNLNDLKPFALLEVRRIDEFLLKNGSCEEDEVQNNDAEAHVDNPEVPDESESVLDTEPVVGESRQRLVKGGSQCSLSDWTEWSSCDTGDSSCGSGTQFRTRFVDEHGTHISGNDAKHLTSNENSCQIDQDSSLVQYRKCFVDCI